MTWLPLSGDQDHVQACVWWISMISWRPLESSQAGLNWSYSKGNTCNSGNEDVWMHHGSASLSLPILVVSWLSMCEHVLLEAVLSLTWIIEWHHQQVSVSSILAYSFAFAERLHFDWDLGHHSNRILKDCMIQDDYKLVKDTYYKLAHVRLPQDSPERLMIVVSLQGLRQVVLNWHAWRYYHCKLRNAIALSFSAYRQCNWLAKLGFGWSLQKVKHCET